MTDSTIMVCAHCGMLIEGEVTSGRVCLDCGNQLDRQNIRQLPPKPYFTSLRYGVAHEHSSNADFGVPVGVVDHVATYREESPDGEFKLAAIKVAVVASSIGAAIMVDPNWSRNRVRGAVPHRPLRHCLHCDFSTRDPEKHLDHLEKEHGIEFPNRLKAEPE